MVASPRCTADAQARVRAPAVAGPGAVSARSRPSAWRLAGALGLACIAPLAAAQGLSASLSLASDQVWRGYSKSQGKASWAADLVWRSDGGWILGAGWLDQRAGNRYGRHEWSLSAGRSWQPEALGEDWTLTGAAARYAHSGSYDHYYKPDYSELSLALDWRGRAYVLLAASPDTDLGWRRGWTRSVEAGWHQRLSGGWSVDLGLGQQDASAIGGRSYTYGSAGLSYSQGAWRLALTRIDSRAVARGAYPSSAAAQPWVFSLLLTR